LAHYLKSKAERGPNKRTDNQFWVKRTGRPKKISSGERGLKGGGTQPIRKNHLLSLASAGKTFHPTELMEKSLTMGRKFCGGPKCKKYGKINETSLTA